MKESSSAVTRQKILEAATDIFGELGYQRVTVRDIVRRAGVNQAAVNYHFRSKDALYSEAVNQALSNTNLLEKITQEIKPLPPDKRLYAFMRRVIETLYGDGSSNCKSSRLVAREIAEPSGISDYTTECYAFIYDTMRQIFLPQTPDVRIRISTLWFLAQSAIIGGIIQKAVQEQGIHGADMGADLFDFSFSLFFKGFLSGIS
jgi:AcrR family transcriptional regulator